MEKVFQSFPILWIIVILVVANSIYALYKLTREIKSKYDTSIIIINFFKRLFSGIFELIISYFP